MEFVDKNKGRDRARTLLKRFLDRCLEMDPYPADLYEAMKSDVELDTNLNPNQKKTYNLLLEWILEESRLPGDGLNNDEGYCCYCMRKIKATETHSTLEHVIPKSITDTTEYKKYLSSVKSELEKDERIMTLKTTFIDKYHSNALPCPHNAAYENLVASCDGSLPKGSHNHRCCNGPRGDKFIPPLMFMSNIHSEIKYKKSGVVVWSDNPDVDKRNRARVINEVLCLNDDILRMIRLIWYYLSEQGLDCNLKEKERLRVIDTLRPKLPTIDRDIIQNFWQDNYWNLLDEYRYFNDVNKFS